MDETTAAILRDTLRGSTPIIPTIPSTYGYLQQGFQTAAALESARQADQRSQAAAQALIMGQQQLALERQKMSLAAATSPYQLALLQEKVRLMPSERKYNQDIQDAAVRRMSAQAGYEEARTQGINTPPPVLDPVQPPPSPPVSAEQPDPASPDSTATAPAVPAAATTSANDNPFSDQNSAPPNTDFTVPLSANDLTLPPSADDDGPITLPSFDNTPPTIAGGDLAAVSGADDPKKATVYRGGKQVSGPNVTLPDMPAGDTSDLPQPDGPTAEPGSTPSTVPTTFGGTMLPADAPASAGDLLGYHVPTSEADAKAQRDYFNQRMAKALANPAYSTSPRNQRAVEAQLRAEDAALARAEGQFNANRTNASRTARTASRGATAVDPTATPPDQDGFTFVPRKFAPRVGVSGEYLSADELREQRAKADALEATNAERRIAGAAGGATVQEFQNAQEIAPAQPGGPKQYVVTHTDTRNGQDFEVKRTLSEPVYQALMTQLQPTLYSRANKPATTGPTSAQLIAGMSGDPEFQPTSFPQFRATMDNLRQGDSEFRPVSSDPPPAYSMTPADGRTALPTHLSMSGSASTPPLNFDQSPPLLREGAFITAPVMPGRSIPVAPVVPAAVNTGTALDTAAAQYQPQTQAEKDAAVVASQVQQKKAQQTQQDAANTNEHAKGPNDLDTMVQRHKNNEAGRLDDAQDDLATLLAIKKYRDQMAGYQGSQYSNAGRPVAPGGYKAQALSYTPDNLLPGQIAAKLTEVQQRRARVAAASDVTNYRPTTTGFQYVDPFDGSNLVTGFNDIPTGSGQVKVTKSQ